jgi:Transposase
MNQVGCRVAALMSATWQLSCLPHSSQYLAARLGFAGSRATILRHLLRRQSLPDHTAPRVVGLDEWASKKGLHYGTIAVDLERRTVIDVLPEHSAVSTARWLAGRPSIEVIARDRDGLYADASRQGAPQATQIADRFHLIQNLRVAIERQLSGLERLIRGYRANPGRRVAADSLPPDDEVGEDEAMELTRIGASVPAGSCRQGSGHVCRRQDRRASFA